MSTHFLEQWCGFITFVLADNNQRMLCFPYYINEMSAFLPWCVYAIDKNVSDQHKLASLWFTSILSTATLSTAPFYYRHFIVYLKSYMGAQSGCKWKCLFQLHKMSFDPTVEWHVYFLGWGNTQNLSSSFFFVVNDIGYCKNT